MPEALVPRKPNTGFRRYRIRQVEEGSDSLVLAVPVHSSADRDNYAMRNAKLVQSLELDCQDVCSLKALAEATSKCCASRLVPAELETIGCAGAEAGIGCMDWAAATAVVDSRCIALGGTHFDMEPAARRRMLLEKTGLLMYSGRKYRTVRYALRKFAASDP